MSSSADRIELLVQAFKAAWNHYFGTDRNRGVLECLARPALAEFLVNQVRDGVDDLPTLAAAGLEFLFSMEDPLEAIDDLDELPWNIHLGSASASFIPVGHIRWLSDV